MTVDALNTQKNIAAAIVDAGADYVIAVKGNHPELEAEIERVFNEASEKKI